MKSGLQNSEARIAPSEPAEAPATTGGMPDLGGMADMLRGMGGGAGGGAGGGMPDLASLMNNPMMMQMAQQMMANGGIERLMQNPTVANMVITSNVANEVDTDTDPVLQMNQMQSGGGMPSMADIMGDPQLREL